MPCGQTSIGWTSSAAGKSIPAMLGAKGTTTASTTVGKFDDGVRIDVENGHPGQRPGQIHVQCGRMKYLYDHVSEQFKGDPPNAVKDLMKEARVRKAIAKGLRLLGESKLAEKLLGGTP